MSDRRPPRVLHIFGRMHPGGAEVRLLEVMRRLCPQEFRIDVCALSGLPGALDPEVDALGGRVVPLRLDAHFPLRFLRLLREGQYDVVHSHVLYTSGLILALAALAGIPVRIAHFRAMHDGRAGTLRRRGQRRLMRGLIDRFATDIVGCGEGAMDAVWRAGWRTDSRCRIIYNTVDLARFENPVDRARVRTGIGVPVSARLFVHVGNHMMEKNHPRLLAIFSAIQRASPNAWLVLAGAGTADPHGAIAARIRELGIQDRVVALGLRDDVPALLKSADVLLLPSKFEGLPGVVLEACASGVPVLASDLPGVREIATRLSLVRHLPLSVSDDEWAAAALALPEEAERLQLRERAAEAFRPSVFHVDRSVEAHRLLWGGVSDKGALACS